VTAQHNNTHYICSASIIGQIDTQLLATQVYLRKEKLLLVLRALKKAGAIDASHPDYHVSRCAFISAVEKKRGTTNTIVQSVIDDERKTLPGGNGSIAEINNAFLAANTNSLTHRLAVVRVTLANDVAAAAKQAKELLVVKKNDINAGIKECEDVHRFLTSSIKDSSVAEAFKAVCSCLISSHSLAIILICCCCCCCVI
jgi:hypothetical protein